MYIFGYFFEKETFKGLISKKGTSPENFGGLTPPRPPPPPTPSPAPEGLYNFLQKVFKTFLIKSNERKYGQVPFDSELKWLLGNTYFQLVRLQNLLQKQASMRNF